MKAILLIILAYGLLCAFTFWRQDSLIFFPVRSSEKELISIAERTGFKPWRNSAGEIIGWESTSGSPSNALLVFHGNAGYAIDRLFLKHLALTAPSPDANGTDKFRTYILEYPGYGARAGKPSEQSLSAAGIEAVDTLVAAGVDDIVILGQSLGTGVASAVAGKRPAAIDGLILVTPFNSLVAAAETHHPWLPVSLLIRHRFDSEQNLKSFQGPVALVVAEEDASIPPELGRKLFDKIKSEKRIWSIPEAHHNDFDRLFADWNGVITWLLNARGTGRSDAQSQAEAGGQ